MSRKNSVLIIFIAILLMVGGLIYFYFSSGGDQDTTNVPSITANPFGNVPGNIAVSTSTKTGDNDQTVDQVISTTRLMQLYRNPTSGSVFFTNNNNQNVIRFVDRAVGNVYEYIPEIKNGGVKRITNTTIPKIQEVVWSNSGSDLVFRYLDGDTDNISSFSGKIKTISTSTDSFQELTGLFLPTNIKQLSVNPTGNKIFELVDKSDKSGTYGFTTNLDGGGKKMIFESQISYFNISWPKENTVTLTTKPNYKDTGLLYFFNTQTYSVEKILGNILGMSTLTNNDTSLVAYSYSTESSLAFNVYDVANKISKDILIKTLVDKCVWGSKNDKILYCAIPKIIPLGNYPDDWYQGLQSFSDNIWKIDTETGNIELSYQIGVNEGDIDAFDFKISLDDKYLSFSNKNDLSLWLLNIEE